MSIRVFYIAITFVLSSIVVPLSAAPNGPVQTTAAIRSDVSPPLRGMSALAPSSEQLREKPLRPIPHNILANNAPDPVVQQSSGLASSATIGLQFPGIGQGDYGFTDQYAPPDTNGAVGATQYIQWVNTDLAVFDKTTGAIAKGFPKPANAIWSGFGGGCETNNDGDPIVKYDQIANRWVLTQFSVSTTPYLQCVAVSTTSDATGSYNRYAFSYGNIEFIDYPKLAVWPDAYYVSYNIFDNGRTFAGAKVCAFDRTSMLAGKTATQQCFQLSTSYGGLLPSDLDGATAPPSGSPNFFLNFGTNSLNLWKFHVDWSAPSNTTLSGPTNIPVAAFTPACNGGGACIPQPSTNEKLDSLADRLMYRLAYRNFSNSHESLVVNHSVTVGSSKRSLVTSVRWYELRNPSGSTMAAGTPFVYQQGTLDASDGIHRWMGSIAMDKAGNLALGYSASSSSTFPSIRLTGRAPKDTLNTMESETILQPGSGSQLPNLNRWGDYSSMAIDPADDCTFWYTNEYLKTNGSFNWSTTISSFKLPSCQ